MKTVRLNIWRLSTVFLSLSSEDFLLSEDKSRVMPRKYPRLIVTIEEKKRTNAERRILSLLDEAGIPGVELLKGAPQGLVEVWFPDDPKTAIQRLTEICEEDPFAFRHTYRWTPIEAWSEADKRHLSEYVRRFDEKIAPDESWKVEVHRNNSPVDRDAFLEAVTEFIHHDKVDMKAPDKRVHVELVGRYAGLSLLGPGDQLEVGRVTREKFVEFEEPRPKPRTTRR